MAFSEQLPAGNAATGAIILQTLGAFGLRRKDGTQLLAAGKPLALIAYLHAIPKRTASRDHLLNALWSDLSERGGRHALRQTVWYLRQILGDGALSVEPGAVTLTAQILADYEAFLTSLAEGRVSDAVSLYQGEFIPTFSVPGGLGFDHWVEAEREHLRLLFCRAAESTARTLLAKGELREACELAVRVRDADPLDECAWRLVLECRFSSGDRIGAFAEATNLESLLAREDRQPEPTTQALLTLARAEKAATEDPDSILAVELVGREREFAALVAAFRQARRGTAQVVDLVAPAGMGKTRLLKDFARYLVTDRRSVGYARALPVDRDLAWSYVGGVVRQLAALPGAAGVSPAAAAALVSIEPSVAHRWNAVEHARASGPDATRHRIAALTELVSAVTDERPLALLLDDVHWADAMSRDALIRVTSRLESNRVLFVVARRTGAAGPLTAIAQNIVLEPLSVEHTRALLASVGELPAEGWALRLPARLHAATAGSPLLLLETIKLALDTSTLAISDGCWRCDDSNSLEQILKTESALRRRMAQLKPAKQRVLLLLAVAERPVSESVLDAAMPLPAMSNRTRELEALEKGGFVVRIADAWAISHDEIAAMSRAITGSAGIADAHAAMGRAMLQQSDADPRVVVMHLAAAALIPEAAAAATRWFRQARSKGDRRAAALLIGELLGGVVDTTLVRSLVTALPWRIRFERTIRIASVAAAIIMAIGGIGFMAWRSDAASAGVTIAMWVPEQNGGWRMLERTLKRRDLEEGLVDPSSFSRTELVSPDRADGALRPGNDGVLATTRTFPDSGGEDVVVVTSAGAKRVTSQRGDDVMGDWSPDGKALVIQTDRWSERSASDLAILTPVDSGFEVRRLTSGSNTRDLRPLWSPDAARIGFLRQRFDSVPGSSRSICFVTVDGVREECLPGFGYDVVDLAGWATASDVVVAAKDPLGTSRIVAVNTQTGAPRLLAEGTNHPTQSRATGWLSCYCRRNEAEPLQQLVFPVSRPEEAIRLGTTDVPLRVVLSPSRNGAFLDTLLIEPPEGPVASGGEYQLQARGQNAQGAEVVPLSLSWHSSDSTVALVDRRGIVTGRKPGRVAITATSGGWRTATVFVDVTERTASSTFIPDWSKPFGDLWVPFGEPRPFITRSELGPALAPNGDSTFTSGVYLKQALPTREGIEVELSFLAPITSRYWQYLDVKLVPRDDPGLRRWDHRTGPMPLGDQPWKSCGIYYPNEWRRDQVELVGGFGRIVTLRQLLNPPRWIRIALQFRPDGRCALSVDGAPPVVLDRQVPLGDSSYLVIDGYSHRTRILVGPVTVRLGIPGRP